MLRFSVVVNKLSLLSWILATSSACQRATGQTDEISWINFSPNEFKLLSLLLLLLLLLYLAER